MTAQIKYVELNFYKFQSVIIWLNYLVNNKLNIVIDDNRYAKLNWLLLIQ